MRRRTLALAATLAALPWSAAAQEAPPVIVVQGQASLQIEPDRATVRLGVETQSETARAAQSETNAKASRIVDAIRALGVDASRIQTSQLTLFPVYDRPTPERPAQRPDVIGYRATNTVSVELDDPSQIGPVVDAAIEAGANRVDGIDLSVDDEAGPRREALAAAVHDARSKAEAIAAALGVTLGLPLETTEHGVSLPRRAFERTEMMMAQDAGTPVQPGRISVEAALTIRYAIEGEGDS